MRPHNRKLLWSPHSREVFAIGASEHLKLYEFCKPSGGAASASTALQVEDTAGVRPPSVRLLSSVSDVQQLRCVAWCPLTAAPWILAVGTASGRVVLHDCAPTGAPGPTTVRSEFVPGVPRACFAVSWNEVRTNLIAAALDKVRGDSGVLVWDLNAQSATQQARGGAGGAALGAGHARPPPELHCGSALRSSGVAFDTADDFSSCVAFDISSVGAVHCDEVPAAEGGASP